MTSHGYKQNEISQELTKHGDKNLQNKLLLYSFKSIFV
jgi:hypothetical protein